MFSGQRPRLTRTGHRASVLRARFAVMIAVADSIHFSTLGKEPIDSQQGNIADRPTTICRRGLEMACLNVLRAYMSFLTERKRHR